MSNLPLERRLAEMNCFFIGLIKPMVIWLVMMSVMRAALWACQRSLFANATDDELAKCFSFGVRFDLLVLGFILIPIVAAAILAVLTGLWGPKLERAMKWALSVMWTIVIVFSFCDFIFFAQNHRRWTTFDAQLSGLGFLRDGISALGWPVLALVFVLFLAMWSFGSRKVEHAVSPLTSVLVLPLWKQTAVIFWPLITVALMSRGTVTAHHLERAHSLISSSTPLNELTVNALWAFDKQPGA